MPVAVKHRATLFRSNGQKSREKNVLGPSIHPSIRFPVRSSVSRSHFNWFAPSLSPSTQSSPVDMLNVWTPSATFAPLDVEGLALASRSCQITELLSSNETGQPVEGRRLTACECPRSDRSPNIGKKNKLIKTFLCFAALLTATCRPDLSGQCACREPFPSLWNR